MKARATVIRDQPREDSERPIQSLKTFCFITASYMDAFL